MLHDTSIRKASPHVLLVLLLVLGTLMAGCGGPASPAPTSRPPATPAAVSGPTSVLIPGGPPLMVADFDKCSSTNNLGGSMGAAYNLPDILKESYPQEPNRGCVARLEYSAADWAAFFEKLEGADLSPYDKLVFEIRAEPQPGIPNQIKLEVKRPGEVSIAYVSGIGAEWKTVSVRLADFGSAGYGTPVSSWQDMEEWVFTFEASRSGPQGVVFLDNLTFAR